VIKYKLKNNRQVFTHTFHLSFGRRPSSAGGLLLLQEGMPMKSEARYKKTAPFRMTYEANRKLILASQELCAICGKPVDKSLKSPDPMSATVDHIIPIAKGGHPSDISNLQLAHRICNRAKSDKIGFEKKEEQNFNRDLPQSRNWAID
jgi:5-methylcytosine-specific restriction endonuclease McrA